MVTIVNCIIFLLYFYESIGEIKQDFQEEKRYTQG